MCLQSVSKFVLVLYLQAEFCSFRVNHKIYLSRHYQIPIFLRGQLPLPCPPTYHKKHLGPIIIPRVGVVSNRYKIEIECSKKLARLDTDWIFIYPSSKYNLESDPKPEFDHLNTSYARIQTALFFAMGRDSLGTRLCKLRLESRELPK